MVKEGQIIPKKIHYIWLQNPLPDEYFKNIVGIRGINPDYEMTFWTNRIETLGAEKEKELRGLGVRIALISDATSALSSGLKEVLSRETGVPKVDGEVPNWGAASDILRIAILKMMGGVYLDTDVSILNGAKGWGQIHAWLGFLFHNNAKRSPRVTLYGNAMIAASASAPLLRILLREMERRYASASKRAADFWKQKMAAGASLSKPEFMKTPRLKWTMAMTGPQLFVEAISAHVNTLPEPLRLAIAAGDPHHDFVRPHDPKSGWSHIPSRRVSYFPPRSRVFTFPAAGLKHGWKLGWR